MIDIRQSIQYANYLKSQGWKVERISGVNYFIKKFPIVGSVLKLQRPEKIDFETIDRLCRKYRIFQIVAEPTDTQSASLLANHGFKPSKNPYLPSKTLHLKLTLPVDRLIAMMKKDTRQTIKRGQKLPVIDCSSPANIEKWRKAWKNSVKLSRYVPSEQQLLNLKKNFNDDNSLFLASHNIVGRIIGGALFTKTSHGVAYYWYGFTNDEGRSTLSQYSLLYQGILWAKRGGCKIFDFEGIYDSRFPNKSWLGFTHFKKSFGGKEVAYPGCYTRFQLFR